MQHDEYAQELDWAFGFSSDIKGGSHTLADHERDVRPAHARKVASLRPPTVFLLSSYFSIQLPMLAFCTMLPKIHSSFYLAT